MPSVRFDNHEQNDGTDDYDELALNMTYYYQENVKILLEYWTQTETPFGIERNNRLTLQIGGRVLGSGNSPLPFIRRIAISA